MTTRLQLRSILRRRLEDNSGTPLWDDVSLNELLADAVRRYGIRFPAEKTEAIVVADGATTILVDDEIAGSDIVAVRDGNGVAIARTRPEAERSWAAGQSWRWWNGSLVLSSPAVGGTWEVDRFSRRELAANDVDAVNIRSGDEEIVVLLAAASALMRRAVELSKRGIETGGLTLTRVADRHSREAETLMQARRRRVTGGWISE